MRFYHYYRHRILPHRVKPVSISWQEVFMPRSYQLLDELTEVLPHAEDGRPYVWNQWFDNGCRDETEFHRRN